MENHIVITQSNFIEVYEGAVVIIIDRKTGKIVRRVPLDKAPLLAKNAEVFRAATNVLIATEGVEGYEGLHTQATKAIKSSLKTLEDYVELNPQPEPPSPKKSLY